MICIKQLSNKIKQLEVTKQLSKIPILQSSSWQVSQLTEGARRCQFNPDPAFFCACISQQVEYGSACFGSGTGVPALWKHAAVDVSIASLYTAPLCVTRFSAVVRSLTAV